MEVLSASLYKKYADPYPLVNFPTFYLHCGSIPWMEIGAGRLGPMIPGDPRDGRLGGSTSQILK